MKEIVATLVATMCLIRATQAAPTPAVKWQEPEYKRRIAFILPAFQQAPTIAGLVFTGADFYRWTGLARPPVTALRLHTPSGPIVLQVEERDGTGFLKTETNGVLDDDDRVVFAVKLLAQPQTVHLYYDGPATSPREGQSKVEAISQPDKLYPLLLKCGALTLGLRGGGVEPTSTNRIENHGRGSLAFFQWQGLTMAGLEGNWGFYFPRTIASGPGAPVWSQPKVVVQGPVRTVVEMRCEGYSRMEDGDRTMEGSITHYVSLWSNAPIVDLEEVVDYQATRLEAQWYYSGQIPVGKDLDEHDCLIVPLAGAAQVVPVKETREHRLAHPWRGLYSTDNPEEGWFAWQDPNEKTGLATFYEKMDRIEFRQAWVTYRPALHPSVSIRTTPYTAPEVNLFFRDRALRCRSRYTRELRYTALREEQPEDLRRLYHLWARPLDQAARVAWPEGK